MNPRTKLFLLGAQRLRPYYGQVASRCYATGQFSSPNKQIMGRTRHVCQTDVSSIQLVYPCFQGAEVVLGANATITAAVEYPVSTFTQVKFSGATQGTIIDGSYIVSDPVSVTIPKGATFYSRAYFTNTAGIVFTAYGSNTSSGEAATFAASGVVDQTMGGTVTASSGAVGYGPIAIIGQTSVPSIAVLGDSRAAGLNDTMSGTATGVGEITRSINDTAPYTNLSIPSVTAAGIVTNGQNSVRLQMARYCSHVIFQLGTNDMSGGDDSSVLLAHAQQIRSWLPGRPFYPCTVAPRTTSTDSWATTVNQTPISAESRRVAYNAILRNGQMGGASGFIEIADQVESARDSGLWKAPGWTTDGIHESQTAHVAIQNSGAINTAAILARVRP